MYNALRKFLALRHRLALPGIGNFIIETSPAQIDFINRSLYPSLPKLLFSADNGQVDKDFYSFLAGELNMEEPQAIRQFTEFSLGLQSQLNEQKTIRLEGIGQLTKQSAHLMNFQPEEIVTDYFPVLTVERVIRKNATHVVKVGEQEKTSTEMQTALHHEGKKISINIRRERWWIPAAILAFIGIAAIIVYYATHPA